jgi:hypothetical protein
MNKLETINKKIEVMDLIHDTLNKKFNFTYSTIDEPGSADIEINKNGEIFFQAKHKDKNIDVTLITKIKVS